MLPADYRRSGPGLTALYGILAIFRWWWGQRVLRPWLFWLILAAVGVLLAKCTTANLSSRQEMPISESQVLNESLRATPVPQESSHRWPTGAT